MVREALRERFLESLEAAGGSVGNTRLRESLGWQYDTYWNVHAALIDEGNAHEGEGSDQVLRAATGRRMLLP
jgi:type I restriction enzyme M protein